MKNMLYTHHVRLFFIVYILGEALVHQRYRLCFWLDFSVNIYEIT